MKKETFLKAIELNNELNNTLSIIRMIESGSTITVSLSFRTKLSNDDFNLCLTDKTLKRIKKAIEELHAETEKEIEAL